MHRYVTYSPRSVYIFIFLYLPSKTGEQTLSANSFRESSVTFVQIVFRYFYCYYSVVIIHR